MMLIPLFLQIFYFLFFMNSFYKLNKFKGASIFLVSITSILIYLFNLQDISVLGKIMLLFSFFLYTVYIFKGQFLYKIRTMLIGVFIISSSEFIAVTICRFWGITVNTNDIQTVFYLTIMTQLLNYLVGGSIVNILCGKKYFRNIFYLSYPFVLVIIFLFSIDYHIFSSKNLLNF